jgi:mannose-6-phosphate isomerase-like protein (cupin superfamily)
MEKVAIDDLDDWMGPADVKRPVSKALDATDLAMNYFELAPSESFAFGYHRHGGQEEVFYVLAGEATFETEDGEVIVGADEAVRFAPNEWQQGFNRGEERVRALALGAPQESGETDVLCECEACGERTPQEISMAESRDALVTTCLDCGAETGRFD